jgi:Ca2+-binding EF-hand superfamily protein
MRLHSPFALLAVFVLTGCSTPTHHWSPVAPSRHEDWHAPYNLLLRYDANNDGIVTRRELEAGLRQDFWQADTNHDGLLDPDEVRAANLRRIRIDESTAIPLIDWNSDGYVDFGEFASGVRSLFEQYDADGDGNVTLDEMHIRLQKLAPGTPRPDDASGGSH